MHMSDALVSPVVGVSVMLLSFGALSLSVRQLSRREPERTTPLMGVLGAFVFACQMINFGIAGTGSSGHLGGGVLLAILLGPYAGLIVMASILMVQALFFADGGLLAWGCNVWNLGVIPCMIAYPIFYKPLAGSSMSLLRLSIASMVACVLGLQLGSLGVVVETVLSGVTALPLSTFLWVMQPIHLAIGVVEGLATATLVVFIVKSRPELLARGEGLRVSAAERFSDNMDEGLAGSGRKQLVWVFALLTVVVGGVLSWFASSHPDGLEWALECSGIVAEMERSPVVSTVHNSSQLIQEQTAYLPDYGFAREQGETSLVGQRVGLSMAGIVGSALVFGVMVLIVCVSRKIKRTSV